MRPRFLPSAPPHGYAMTHYPRRGRVSRLVRFLIHWFCWN